MVTPVPGVVNPTKAKAQTLTEATIEFRDVEYRITITDSHSILSGISLKIHPGETIALLGRSGSGKTTMLKLINRLRECSCGELFVENQPVRDWDVIRLRRRIGYIIQEVGLFPHFTIEQNVCLVPGLENWPAERIKSRFEEVMQSVGLNPAEHAGKYPREALLLATRVVLLDAGRIVAEASPSDFLKLDQKVARDFIAASELVAGA